MHTDFSSAEQASQILEQMHFINFEKQGVLAQKGLYLILALMLTFTIWAAFAESDVCAEATGRLEPVTYVQAISPPTDGTIFKYNCVDGQFVKKGDVLIELNTIRAEAELHKKEQELSILKIEYKEHENARDGLERVISNPNHIAKEVLALPEADRLAGELFASKKALDSAIYDTSTQNNLNDTDKISSQMTVLNNQKMRLESVKQSRKESVIGKVREREAEKKKLDAKICLLRSSLEKANTQLSELQTSLADAKKEMEIYERGRQLGVASEVKFLDIQNYMHQREFSVGQQKLQITELEQELKSAQVDLQATQLAYNADQADLAAGIKAEDTKITQVPISMNETIRNLQNKKANYDVASFHARARYSKELSELNKLERKISETEAAIKVLRQQLAERQIRSPVDGYISGLMHMLPGEIVLRAQHLMVIVPSDKEIVLRAEVNNTDVGFIELGQIVRLRIEAFPCEDFGTIQGKVIRVDEYPEDKVEGQKKESVYKVTIKPDSSFIIANHKKFYLRPGLRVHADIVIKKRSFLALLFEPLLRMNNE